MAEPLSCCHNRLTEEHRGAEGPLQHNCLLLASSELHKPSIYVIINSWPLGRKAHLKQPLHLAKWHMAEQEGALVIKPDQTANHSRHQKQFRHNRA